MIGGNVAQTKGANAGRVVRHDFSSRPRPAVVKLDRKPFVEWGDACDFIDEELAKGHVCRLETLTDGYVVEVFK